MLIDDFIQESWNLLEESTAKQTRCRWWNHIPLHLPSSAPGEAVGMFQGAERPMEVHS